MANQKVRKKAAKNQKIINTKRPAKKSISSNSATKKASRSSQKKSKQARANNSSDAWQTYKTLQNQVHKAWSRLQSNVRKQANTDILLKDRNELLLLLGECNYMARECMRNAKTIAF